MKKLIAIFVLSLMTISTSFAGENPKLWREINRKLKIDVSQVDLSDMRKNSVVVKFRIVAGEIEIIKAEGSEELRALIIKELEEMFITSDSESDKVYRYRFNFRKEG